MPTPSRYTAPSGARVFAAASLQFAWGLDPLQERYDAAPRPLHAQRARRPHAPGAAGCGRRRSHATAAGADRGVPDRLQRPGHRDRRLPAPRAPAPSSRRDPGVVQIPLPRCTRLRRPAGPGVFRYAVAYASRWRTSVPPRAGRRDRPAPTPPSGASMPLRAHAPVTLRPCGRIVSQRARVRWPAALLLAAADGRRSRRGGTQPANRRPGEPGAPARSRHAALRSRRGDRCEPGAACRRLLAAGRAIFAPTPPGTACTQIYGGPQIAVVTGTLAGRRVWARFRRRDGCEVARWNRVAFLLPVR